MKQHKFIRIMWINDWSDKDGDKHITPVLSFARKHYFKHNYYNGIAIEWWCWALCLGVFSLNVHNEHAQERAKKIGRLNIFGRKLF